MTRLVPLALALTIGAGAGALAQTTPPPSTAPSATSPPAASPSTPAAKETAPSASPGASTTAPTAASRDVILTEEEARNWIDKVVYSKDNENVGEVAAFNRDSSGKVTELHADIGGFMGLGERRVKLMPSQFSLQGDRVVLNISSEEVKALPAIAKN